MTGAVFSGPQDTTVLRGATATLTCSDPDYTGAGVTLWLEGGTAFANEGGIFNLPTLSKYQDFRVEASTSTPITKLDLVIPDAQVGDEGTYECELSPGTGAASFKVESKYITAVRCCSFC